MNSQPKIRLFVNILSLSYSHWSATGIQKTMSFHWEGYRLVFHHEIVDDFFTNNSESSVKHGFS